MQSHVFNSLLGEMCHKHKNTPNRTTDGDFSVSPPSGDQDAPVLQGYRCNRASAYKGNSVTSTQQRGAVGGVCLTVAHDSPEQAVLDRQLRYSAQKHELKVGEEWAAHVSISIDC